MALLHSSRLRGHSLCLQALRKPSKVSCRSVYTPKLNHARHNASLRSPKPKILEPLTSTIPIQRASILHPKYSVSIPFRVQTADLATATQDAPRALPEYKPPTTGLLSYLPKPVVPYAELIRLDKPTGTYYLFFPCVFSTLVAATMATPMAAPSAVAGTTALFFTGALVMRGAGCTINDLWDRNLDPHVERTRLRPIARKAISPQAAIVFTGAQLLTGLGVLLSLPFECFWYATPSLLFVAMYPLAKRVTNYPQFVLGLTFSWGAMMGFPALGVDLLSNQPALIAAACLYASNVAWTVLYDMIYAHMDIKDDAKVGIKSIALKHDKDTKAVLTGLAAVQLGLLAATGVAAGMGPVYFTGALGSAVVTLGTMIWRVQLKDIKNCWWWFKNGAWFTGGGITMGLTGEYLAQYLGWYDDEEKSDEGSKEP
ncbi:putative para-hydroxybenzoate-polyprenyltransferase Coq2 [Bimuria novae-zelandiae CBS 107.79]|uniref:4-hydroxybenzoate polyprenyltransferase, mitochondrial n=1 Tax=Bimuria novae-zelandiae CBS 107.79 TaxID=1447943 RepID=A0A6A5VK82_9PLEO|nr:putative para-hydroxybenzoate-polyprenyltransferase Coq2 [Bimuria novae-zelandiae CBS 107.79]